MRYPPETKWKPRSAFWAEPTESGALILHERKGPREPGAVCGTRSLLLPVLEYDRDSSHTYLCRVCARAQGPGSSKEEDN